jgi:hypothetical protein
MERITIVMIRPKGPTTDGGQPGPAMSEGIHVECLDLTVRRAATYLFPKERGIDLLALLFLHVAEVQPQEIDGYGQVEVAIIRLQSIEVFARQHGWGKDTALRYIAVLEALQVLRRYRHAEYTELHVPLIPWHPSIAVLNALDALLASDAAREKLQYNCMPAYVSCNSIKGDQHPPMLSPSSRIAATFPHIQKYLKTCQTLGEVDE